MRKIIFSTLILLFSFSGLYASERQVFFYDRIDDRKPRRNEVVVVTRVSLSPAPNMEFYERYNRIFNIRGNRVYSAPRIFFPARMTDRAVDYFAMGDEGALKAIKINVPRDGIIRVDFFRCFLINQESVSIALPLFLEFTVPEGASYIYIGSFTYEWTGYQFDIGNVRRTDEFDAAAKFVAEKYGADATLVRVPTREMTPPEGRRWRRSQ